MAVNGEAVFAGLERGPACAGEVHHVVGVHVTTGSHGQHAVDIDFDVLVVVEPGLEVAALVAGQFDVAAEPDVGGVPGRADDRAGGANGAKAAASFRPGRAVERGAEPIGGRARGGEMPPGGPLVGGGK